MSFFAITSTLGGRASEPETPPGDPDFFDPESGDITFTDDHFQHSAPGLAKTGFVMRSPAGLVELRGELTDLEVKVGGNWSGHSSQSKVWLTVNDVFNQEITLTADNVTQNVAITSLSPGLKTIKLINGYAASAAPSTEINRPAFGVYVQGIITSDPVEIKIPVPPAKRIVLLSMSIGTGASADKPTLTSWPMQARAEGYAILLDSYGARTLSDNDMHFFDAHADSMVAYLWAEMDGTDSNELWIDLVTNDFFYGKSKASYKTHLTLLVTKMKLAHPSVRIILIRPTDRSAASGLDYDAANVNGATLGDLKDAQEEVAVEQDIEIMGDRSYGGLANAPDGLHGNQAWHDAMWTAIKTDYLAL